MFLLTLPLATLPWGDVNFLIVTDVHSWVAGHLHPDHDPMLDANYGHLLSMHEHLAAAAAARGRDLFFVDNGDLNDGTGFSRKPPAALVPLLRRMPFDALTTGNHELYENENIDFLAQPGGFIDSWGGRFLTSNTENATTGEPLGARYRILNGTSGRRVLAGADRGEPVVVPRRAEGDEHVRCDRVPHAHGLQRSSRRRDPHGRARRSWRDTSDLVREATSH
jgi:2',3'-cyclic-nucleotide 2'-phosphodiesterase (5'-nucleotidase family)